MDRLVLGCAAVGRTFVERLAERPDSLTVISDEAARAESLREAGIDAKHADIADAAAVKTIAGAADSVVVAPAADALPTAVGTAERAYPDAFRMACLDGRVPDAERRAISGSVDRVLDVPVAVGRSVAGRSGDGAIRPRKLRAVIEGIEGKLAVVAHDNPDPDAIASAVGLRRIAADAGVAADACYYGDINHQENRALVNLLEFDLRNLPPDADLGEYDAVALVDHSRPGVNDGLPEGTPVDIVIDHHPPRKPIQARFVDLRSDVGATCTLVAGYLSDFGIDLDAALASGLLYGIRTDTQGFRRGVSIADFEAAADLVGAADTDALRRIESPNVSVETMSVLARAISNRTVREGVLTTCVGAIADRDTLAQAADRLLDMDGITMTLVFGYTEETVFVSGRTRGTDRDIGETLREAFDQIGSAGGHADMAGAQIPTGILVEETDPDERGEVIAEVIADRFFEALGITPDYPDAIAYSAFAEETGFDSGG